ncbi:protein DETOXIFICATION 43-like [Vicia villosa]|uniref:protein DETOXIFICATION 43-like n=1 Tax=Vicia villosa TaxID=3911 RepID=UPI00273B24CA|nr:protein DETOXIFICATION 43-like [Vicia villosa]
MNENGSANELNKKWNFPFLVFFHDARLIFKLDALSREILGIALPSALAVAADPIASLIDTAYIGHLGAVELAAAGVSIALFNQASKITIFPLVSITTSFVAEEDTIKRMNIKAAQNDHNTNLTEPAKPHDHVLHDIEKGTSNKENNNVNTPKESQNETNGTVVKSCAHEDEKKYDVKMNNEIVVKKKKNKRHIASASTALLFGSILGLIQASILIFAAKPLLSLMGVKHGSPMLKPAVKYLTYRSIGAPAVLLSLAMQGVFRGFKDTTTPLYVIVAGYSLNVLLAPLLIFKLKMGLKGAAISHVISQYMMAFTLFFILMKKVYLLPPRLKDLQIFRFLRNGGLLMTKVIAVTFCVTLAASLAARLGSIPMAAFQPCLQVWLASSLFADGLAIAVQAILAGSFAEKDYIKTTAAATRTLQFGFLLGVGLSLIVGVGLYFGAGIFSKNLQVIHFIRIGAPIVAATQPINTLAFVFDGVNYGASDFAYASYSLVTVSLVSVGVEFLLYRSKHFIGIWIALAIYMTLRMLAGVWRMGTGTGPWSYLRGR